jgi:HSP90 family molecular chaperone
MAVVTKKARTLVVTYTDKAGAYLADSTGEYIEFKVGGTLNKSFKLYPELLEDSLKKRAMFHGLNQKVRDSAAGKDKTEQQQYEAMQEVCATLMEGAWDKAREGAQVSDERLITAMHRLRPNLAIEQVTASIKAATPEQKKTLIANPKFAAMLAQIRADELASKATDAGDDLLDELLGAEEEEEEGNE